MMVGFRSWRDTGITWLAIAGVDVAKMRRAGHDHVGTTMTYVKAAEDLGGTIGEPFPPLPFALIGSLEKANQEPTSTSRLTRRRDAKEESGGEGGIRNRERA